jgi:hypothetical protein
MIDKLITVRATMILVLALTVGCAQISEPEGQQPSAQKTMKVFILAGQSNMGNTGHSAEVSEELRQGNVRIQYFFDGRWQTLRPLAPPNQRLVDKFGWTENTFGPELGFGDEMGKAWPDEEIGIIKVSVVAASINTWQPDWSEEEASRIQFGEEHGAIYPTLMETIEAARSSRDDLEFVGLIWNQGGADYQTLHQGKAYLDNFKVFVSAVRRDVGVADLPLVLGTNRVRFFKDLPDDLSDFDPATASPPPVIPGEQEPRVGLYYVLKAQFNAQYEIPNAKTVVLRDLPSLRGEVHWNAEGHLMAGRALAQGFLELKGH